MTAVFLTSGSPRAQVQQQSAIPAHASLAPAAHVAPSVSTPTAIDVANHDAASLVPSPPTSAAVEASGVNAAPTPSAAKTATQAPAPAEATVQEGSRVRIQGLQAKPELNGRTGVVCGAFSQESGRWTVQITADGERPACHAACRAANLKVIESAAAVTITGASVACDTESVHSLIPPSTSAAPSPPSAASLKEGSRVRIQGLHAKPELNGRTGVVCGAFSQESGRWTVQIDADGARAACRGAFRAANLQVIPSHNFGTEWVDEEGRVWSKNVDFSRECAKGHALAPLGDCARDGGGMRLMCRLCHSFCGRDSDEAASWLTCSVVAGCCGGYAVCCSCARAPSAVAAVESAGSGDFCTLVSCGVECCMMRRLMFGVAGCWTAVSVVAAVDVGRVAGPHDDVPVLSNVRATVHVAQPRQRGGAADGAGRHCTACGRCDVVYQPRVEQRVCRHA